MSIKSINCKGPLILDTTVSGEQKQDGVMSSSPQCIQLSPERWMLLAYTRGFTCTDDERSVYYQIRAGAPDGTILTEKCLSPAVSDWAPFGGGERLFKVHGHALGFGMPRAAAENNAVNSNVFCASWYTFPRLVRDGLRSPYTEKELFYLERVHFGLNAAEDDIEISAPPTPLAPSRHCPDACFQNVNGHYRLNHWYPVPWNSERSAWVCMGHYGGTVAAILNEFNPATGLYEWTRTGPAIRDDQRALSEASICQMQDEWIICCRSSEHGGQTGWCRCRDPFVAPGAVRFMPEPATYGPRNVFVCADGVMRIICGDINASPYGEKRNPLYIWDVDPHDFRATNRRVLFDARNAGLGFRTPFVGFPKLFPAQGNRQLVSFRVTCPNKTFQHGEFPPLLPQEIKQAGAYYAEIVYD